jgi:dolichyl-phosphate beta-glucosyltransferase
MELSVVIPVYNGAGFVAERLRLLAGHLDRAGFEYEIVVVDDGSTDGTGDVLRALGHPRVRPLLGGANRGKFGALKRGMAETRGRCALFTDADVPYELASVEHFARLVLGGGFHLVIGDRTLPGSSYAEDMPFLRRVASRAFSWCLRVFFVGGLHDTQCGLKAFRGDVARALFPLLREEGFAGDVEALYLALKHNLAIRRVPVRLRFQGPSTVSAWRHAGGMLTAIFRARLRYGRGEYRSPALEAAAAHDYGPPAGGSVA